MNDLSGGEVRDRHTGPSDECAGGVTHGANNAAGADRSLGK